jgi:hypothetical protein
MALQLAYFLKSEISFLKVKNCKHEFGGDKLSKFMGFNLFLKIRIYIFILRTYVFLKKGVLYKILS